MITDVPLSTFDLPDEFFIGETLGCGGPGDRSIVCVGDEVAVTRFTATFTDGLGNHIQTFGEDTVQAVSQELFLADGVTPLTDANGIPLVSQTVTWVLWSIRFEDVGPLVPDGLSLVTIRLDDTVLAQAALTGDSVAGDAVGVSFFPVEGGGSLDSNLIFP